jgi:hypothetical protein
MSEAREASGAASASRDFEVVSFAAKLSARELRFGSWRSHESSAWIYDPRACQSFCTKRQQEKKRYSKGRLEHTAVAFCRGGVSRRGWRLCVTATDLLVLDVEPLGRGLASAYGATVRCHVRFPPNGHSSGQWTKPKAADSVRCDPCGDSTVKRPASNSLEVFFRKRPVKSVFAPDARS